MTDSKKKVARALVDAKFQREIEAEMLALVEKQHAISRAEGVILTEICRWTGIEVSPGDRIPIIRDGRKVGEIPETYFVGSPVVQVAKASLIEHKSEIERKIVALQSVMDSSERLIEALSEMTYFDRARLGTETGWVGNALRGNDASLLERLIREIGTVTSAMISARALVNSAKKQVGELQDELEKRKTKRGRPRNEAAHAVARELALLYAKITGKRPTFADGANGLSGDFTPALRDVFDALGWQETNLRGPAQAAISIISESEMQYEEKGLSGLLSAAWPN